MLGRVKSLEQLYKTRPTRLPKHRELQSSQLLVQHRHPKLGSREGSICESAGLEGPEDLTGGAITGVQKGIPKSHNPTGVQLTGMKYQAGGRYHYISTASGLGPRLHKHWDD